MNQTRLSVNINKVALLRNSRGSNLPDLVQVAQDCERFGAQGITVHPRPDERHIHYADVPALRPVLSTEFNIEGYPSEAFLQLVLAHPPAQCTLVPDEPGQLTSDHGWQVKKHATFLKEVIDRLHQKNIRVSLFLDDDIRELEAVKEVGADRIELYTGPYAQQYKTDREKAVAGHRACAQKATEMGIGVNAGHDLNLENLAFYAREVPGLLEVSIGHALIADALYFGLQNTIQMYLQRLS